MGLKLSELISKVGDDQVSIQRIDQCCLNANTNKEGETKLTLNTKAFSTTDLAFPEKAHFVGLVVWIPREKMQQVIKENRP